MEYDGGIRKLAPYPAVVFGRVNHQYKRKMEIDFTNTKVAFEHMTDGELRKAHWLFKIMNNRLLVDLGSKIGLQALKWNIPMTETVIKNTIYEQFCGGESLEGTQPTIDHLFENETLTILDYGAEAKESDADFDRTKEEVIKGLIFAAKNESVPVVSTKITGLARFALLQKVQEEKELTPDEQAEWERAISRINDICRKGEELFNVGLFFDAEETWIQDTLDAIVEEMMEKYNTKKAIVYNTFQMYRHDRLEYLKEQHGVAKGKGYILGAKLVRGAYMEKERERAQGMGYEDPIQKDKEATDQDYDAALEYCIRNHEDIASCNASHNEESAQLQVKLMSELGLDKAHPHLNFCQLYGMSDHLTFNISKAGFNGAKYVPYGPVKEVIPYLIRRAQENSSVTGDMGREFKLISMEFRRRKMEEDE